MYDFLNDIPTKGNPEGFYNKERFRNLVSLINYLIQNNCAIAVNADSQLSAELEGRGFTNGMWCSYSNAPLYYPPQ